MNFSRFLQDFFRKTANARRRRYMIGWGVKIFTKKSFPSCNPPPNMV